MGVAVFPRPRLRPVGIAMQGLRIGARDPKPLSDLTPHETLALAEPLHLGRELKPCLRDRPVLASVPVLAAHRQARVGLAHAAVLATHHGRERVLHVDDRHAAACLERVPAHPVITEAARGGDSCAPCAESGAVSKPVPLSDEAVGLTIA